MESTDLNKIEQFSGKKEDWRVWSRTFRHTMGTKKLFYLLEKTLIAQIDATEENQRQRPGAIDPNAPTIQETNARQKWDRITEENGMVFHYLVRALDTMNTEQVENHSQGLNGRKAWNT